MVTSCSKENIIPEAQKPDTTKIVTKIPVNEVAVNNNGIFIIDGKSNTLAKFLNLSNIKSFDTSSIDRYFYTLYKIIKTGSKDTTVEFFDIRFYKINSTNSIIHYEFGDSCFKYPDFRFQCQLCTNNDMNLLTSSLTCNFSATLTNNKLNVEEKYTSVTVDPVTNQHTFLDVKSNAYSINILSIEKNGNYFKGLINDNKTDTITFYQRKNYLDSYGYFKGFTQSELKTMVKSCKIYNHYLPMTTTSLLTGTKSTYPIGGM